MKKSDLQQRHAQYYLEQLEKYHQEYLVDDEAKTLDALQDYDSDAVQISQSWDWANNYADVNDIAMRSCAAFPDIGGYILELRQDRTTRLDWLQRSLQCARNLNHRLAICHRLTSLGSIFDDLRSYQEAEKCYLEALALCDELNLPDSKMTVLGGLANIYLNLQDYTNAENYAQQARSIHEIQPDDRATGYIYNTLGNIAFQQGYYKDALAYYEQALKLGRNVGDLRGIAHRLMNIGVVFEVFKDFSKAIDYFNEALKISIAMHDRSSEADLYGHLANNYDKLNQTERAIYFFEQAVEICQKNGDMRSLGVTLANWGEGFAKNGDYLPALSKFAEATKALASIGLESEELERNITHVQALLLREAEDGISTLKQRHATYYAQLLRDLDDQFTQNIITDGDIGHDWIQITTGQEWAAAYRDEDARALILSADYPNNGTHILPVRLGAHERAQWLVNGAEAAKKLLIPAIEASLLNALGGAYQQLGQYEAAIQTYYRSISIAESINEFCIGSYMNNFGVLVMEMGEYKKAEDFFEQALQYVQQRHDTVSEQIITANLGVVYRNLGELDKAWELHQQSLRLFRKQGNLKGESGALENLAIISATRGNYREAKELFETSLTISRQIIDLEGISNALTNLANIEIITGDYGETFKKLNEALDIDRRREDRRSEVLTFIMLGNLHKLKNEPQKALEAYQMGYLLAESIDLVQQRAEALINIGTLLMDQTDTRAKAKTSFLEAYALGEQHNSLNVSAAALANLANMMQDEDDKQAIDYYQRSYDSFVKLDDRYNQATILCNIGLWYERNKDFEQAKINYKKALHLFKEFQISERIQWLETQLRQLPKSS